MIVRYGVEGTRCVFPEPSRRLLGLWQPRIPATIPHQKEAPSIPQPKTNRLVWRISEPSGTSQGYSTFISCNSICLPFKAISERAFQSLPNMSPMPTTTTPYPAISKQATGEVDGITTDVMSVAFADKIMVTISQGGRLAQWVWSAKADSDNV